MFNAVEKRQMDYSFVCIDCCEGFVQRLISDNGFVVMLFSTIIVGHRL